MCHVMKYAVLVLVMSCGLPGCENGPKGDVSKSPPDKKPLNDTNVTTTNIPSPSPSVQAIALSSQPTAINLDNIPGPDGVQIQIVFWNTLSDVPKAVTLQQGQLECLIFEGRVPPNQLNQAKPKINQAYSAGQLNRFIKKHIVGYRYNMMMQWDSTNVPKGSTITLTARLLRPGGNPLYAKPIYLSLTPR